MSCSVTPSSCCPLSDVDTSVLSQGEWREIRLYGITTLGGTLFNAWD
ncbi:hypothetical protein [Streptomyces flaveolus]